MRIKRIKKLKKQRKAVIIAHNYQPDIIQEIADITGDSLELGRKASKTKAEVIIFCGVKFMAETAAIISPEKTVLLPEPKADCALARMITVDRLKDLKKKHPKAGVVAYVNSPAEIKAESDICCTSSNAVKVVNALPHQEIIFLPDKNLGRYVSVYTAKKVILWEGFCPTHALVKAEEVLKVKEAHPQAEFIAHPECVPEVLALADYVCSTAGMFKYTRETKVKELIIGTEQGMLYRLRKENPGKKFYLASPTLICPNMKLITLDKIIKALERNEYQIKVDELVRRPAYEAIKRMLEVS